MTAAQTRLERRDDGKVVVLTGGTSGIGQVAAVELARRGARIVLVARDRAHAAQALADITRAGPDLAHRAMYADLASIGEVRRVAAEIAAAEPRIDVLINNAGRLNRWRHRGSASMRWSSAQCRGSTPSVADVERPSAMVIRVPVTQQSPWTLPCRASG